MEKKQSYQSLICQQGLSYLTSLDTSKLIALDIETTGLNPDAAQVTQIASIAPVLGSSYSAKAGLTETTMDHLARERNLPMDKLGAGTMHWVLAYNSYHPLNEWLYKACGLCPSDLPSVKRPLAVLSNSACGISYLPVNTPVKLDSPSFQQLKVFSDSRMSESRMLEGFSSWLSMQSRDRGIRLLGQNIIAFDMPFLSRRMSINGVVSEYEIDQVDTMWISRILVIPALRVLSSIGHSESSTILSKLKRGTGRYSSSLQDLKTAFVVEGGKAHDAAGDCQTTIEVLLAMKKYAITAASIIASETERCQEEFASISSEASMAPDKR